MNKTVIIVISLFCLFNCILSFSQNHLIRLNPIGSASTFGDGNQFINYLLYPESCLQYEYIIKNHSSVELNIGYLSTFGKTDINGVKFTIHYKNYRDSLAPSAFYIQPGLSYGFYSAVFQYTNSERYDDGYLKLIDIRQDFSAVGASMFLGYQWLISDNIAFNLNGGFKFFFMNTERNEIIDNKEYKIYRPWSWYLGPARIFAFRFTVGYFF